MRGEITVHFSLEKTRNLVLLFKRVQKFVPSLRKQQIRKQWRTEKLCIPGDMANKLAKIYELC